jgi:hypothetical protein
MGFASAQPSYAFGVPHGASPVKDFLLLTIITFLIKLTS